MNLLRDIAYAARMIRRMPVLASVIVLSIAIGVGVNTAVFSWIQSRVLTPIAGVSRGGDFYLIQPRGESGSDPAVSWPEYRDLAERATTFRDLVAFRMAAINIGAADWFERTYGLFVSGNYFSALDLHAAAGRLLAPEDTATPGGPPVVVVSRRFWQTRLAGAPDVVGRTLRVNDRPFTIVGVVPEPFQGTIMGLTFDLWIPATAAPALFDGTRELDARSARDYDVIGALKPGVSRRDGARQMTEVFGAMAAAYPGTDAVARADVLPQWQSPHGPQQSLMLALGMLQGVMLLVLAVVTGNTTNLVLARATVRRHEAGVMLALGASRARIIRLVVTESLLLSLTGALIGALLAVWGTTALRSVPLPTPAGLQLTFFTRIDTTGLLFASALGLLSGLVIGLPPALQLARTDPATSLRAGGAAPGRSTVRDVLLALEVALAMVVLVVAGLFLKSFNDTRTTDPGFQSAGVLLASYDLRGRTRAIAPEASAAFAAQLIDRLRGVPAVESVALASSVPLDIHGLPSLRFVFEGHARPDGALDQALTNTVTPGYFQTMGIPLVAGRDFADLRDETAPKQAVVNETFVRTWSAGSSDPAATVLGHRITTGGVDYVVTGVVRDSLYVSFGEMPRAFVYLSLRDRPWPMAEIHVRTRAGSETRVTDAVRRAVRGLNAALPLYNVRTLTDHVEANLVFRRVPARMFSVLGPVLLVLVGIGIYAVVAYAVAQRRREIGTRLALGGTAAQVTRALLGETMRVVLLGMAAGGVVALLIDPDALAGRAADVLLLTGVAALFLVTAGMASWVPARRACGVNVSLVLRD